MLVYNDQDQENTEGADADVDADGRGIIIIAIAFVVIFTLVALIFLNNQKKINVDKEVDVGKKLKVDTRVAQTLRQHVYANLTALREKPLINTLTKAYCPGESKGYIPLCSHCNVAMEKTDKKEIFHCPICGQNATFPCPHEQNTKMVTMDSLELSQLFYGAKYICPVCGNAEAPMWDRHGAPLCPYCKNIMRIYSGSNGNGSGNGNSNSINKNGGRL
ncbi:MAG: hypothetical protein HQK53_01430 [Oligoflexia bacterium]|nr:hypothetical protein [Oligoflexia bacterium]